VVPAEGNRARRRRTIVTPSQSRGRPRGRPCSLPPARPWVKPAKESDPVKKDAYREAGELTDRGDSIALL
jgi:hypothetical protein